MLKLHVGVFGVLCSHRPEVCKTWSVPFAQKFYGGILILIICVFFLGGIMENLIEL